MAQLKYRPYTENELLYAVLKEPAGLPVAKPIVFSLSTSTQPPSVPNPDTTSMQWTSFLKEHRTTLLVLGGLTLIGVACYFYYQEKKKKETGTS